MFLHLNEVLVGPATGRFVNEKLRQWIDFMRQIERVEIGCKEVDITKQRDLSDFLEYLDVV